MEGHSCHTSTATITDVYGTAGVLTAVATRGLSTVVVGRPKVTGPTASASGRAVTPLAGGPTGLGRRLVASVHVCRGLILTVSPWRSPVALAAGTRKGGEASTARGWPSGAAPGTVTARGPAAIRLRDGWPRTRTDAIDPAPGTGTLGLTPATRARFPVARGTLDVRPFGIRA